MDTEVYNILKKTGDSLGLPPEVWYPIVMVESGGNPNAHAKTDREDSRGLFQINVNAHPDANSSQLFNPQYNAQYWMPTLKKTYDKGVSQGLTGADLAVYVERYGERPKWTSSLENRVRKYYAEYAADNGITTTPGSSTASPIDAATGSGSNGSIWENVKYYLFTILFFILLIFSLYMVFVYKGGGENASNTKANTEI